MRLLILGEAESFYCRALHAVARRSGHVCEVLNLPELATRLSGSRQHFLAWQDGSSAAKPSGLVERPELWDACIIRSMPAGSLEQIVFRMDLLATLEAAGVRMINSPKGMECAIDKFLTLARCQRAGIRIPETLCCESAAQALEQFQAWGNVAVIKPLFGAEGRGILHLTDPETARRVFRAWEQIGAVITLQRFIQSGGTDLRVLLLGGEPLGAFRRTATVDFRTNCALSGQASPHELTPAEAEMARRAGAAVGVEFAGVDLIYDEQQQLHLLEVNGCPGWQAFQKVTGIPVPDRLLLGLEQELLRTVE